MDSATRMDARALRRWVDLGLACLGEARAEIDALNVFPVPDGDTGTNMYLTFESAAEGAARAADEGLAEVGAGLARGALLGARGNSGVILSQLLRGLAEELSGAAGSVGGEALARAFSRASALADAAVDRPVEGTILTVARAAARGAAGADPDDLGAVLVAAADSAREALARTPDQLEALRRAGVVDAGGRGLVVLLDAMTESMTGRRPPPTAGRVAPAGGAEATQVAGPSEDEAPSPAFEVMFLLEADEPAVARLRGVLAGLGDSLVVVGGDPLWNVHVHVDDAGAAVEAAIDAGRPSRIRITHLQVAEAVRALGRDIPAGPRGLVVVAHGPGIAEVLEGAGATVVRAVPRQRPSTAELLDGVTRSGASEVVLLPSDKDSLQVAEVAAAEARDRGTRVSVIPSRSVVQSLAAVAVHDPDRPFGEDVVSMTRAAGATHYGAVTIAAREGMTSAGICHVGDVLGLVEGDIVEIGDDVGEVAVRVVERLCGGAAEMVTLVYGDEWSAQARGRVTSHLRRERPAVDVVEYEGGQPYWPVIIGVE